ncbi:MAG: transcription antitermination factor NusB [Vulcanimicrobiaceae bacterium]
MAARFVGDAAIDVNAREVALSVVRDVFPSQAGARERGAHEALDYRLRHGNLDSRDAAFATELAYGTIKMRRTLDWYLAPFIGERRNELPPVIAEILRLAVYEIAYTRADEHATVFEFVNLAKKYGHRGVANLVNAVLRGFLRNRPAVPARSDFDDDDEYLGVRYALPDWIVRSWRSVFPPPDVERICSAINDRVQAAATVDVALHTRDSVARGFAQDGVASRPSALAPDCLLVDDAAYLRAREAAAAGAWWIQSESSATPVAVLFPQPGETILDLCSGRGNKTLQILARLAGDGSVTCVDKDERKGAVLQERAALGGRAVAFIAGDATQAALPAGSRFDRILLDAPCSGIGLVARHPEARWKKRADDGERLAALQAALLEAAAPHLHPGGTLVYAACSTDVRETSDVVSSFIKRNHFERGLIPAAFGPFLTPEGDVLIPPGLEGRDGFFVARLDRGL